MNRPKHVISICAACNSNLKKGNDVTALAYSVTYNFFPFFLSQCQRWDLNPRSLDCELSVIPLCYCCCLSFKFLSRKCEHSECSNIACFGTTTFSMTLRIMTFSMALSINGLFATLSISSIMLSFITLNVKFYFLLC